MNGNIKMISRSLFVESKKLRIFDMDDTLITTTSYIYVDNEKSGKQFKLTPGEYAVYTAKDGDVFDYSDFQKIQNPKIIKGYFELLRRMASMGGKDRGVYILTARGAYKPIHKFIKDSGIRGVYVVALGDANPEKKADWIEQQIKDEGYDDVFFVDDSQKNIDAVKKRLRAYPNVKQKIQVVKHSGSTNENVTIKLMHIL
jgi:phosphoglycolate phosphatase-like HAD superfamily hydrolase